MNRSTHRRGRPRRALVLLTALTAAAAVALPTTGAYAGKPVAVPPVITVGPVTSEIDFPDTPGAPSSFVAKDQPFSVGVTLSAPISETKPVTLTIFHAASPDPALGTLILEKGRVQGTFEALRVAEAANDVVLTVRATAPSRDVRDVLPATSPAFDVAKDYDDVPISRDEAVTVSREGVGVPCEATPTRPICADLVLPADRGLTAVQNGNRAFFSTGVCSDGDGCLGQDVLQVLAEFELPNDKPGTLIVKCDKELCGRGAIKDNELLASLAPRGDVDGLLVAVPACAVKGVIDEGLESCVDYVQSRRDGSGDTYLYWLIPRDARFSI